MDVVGISSLSPASLETSRSGFRGIVTLLWPFSSSTKQCALLIADADARRRYQKGQVRVRFTGPSATAIAESGIGIGDNVEIALSGARWLSEADTTLTKTPGKSVDGELLFNHRLHLSIAKGYAEANIIEVGEQSQPKSPYQSMLPPSTPVSRPFTRLSSHFDAYGVAVYSSPAFMKRLRLSEGRTSYTPVSEDDDLDTNVSRKRRRVSYKNVVEWKFDTREPSPEKDQFAEIEQEEDIGDVMDTSEAVATPTKEPATTPQESIRDSMKAVEESRSLVEESLGEPLEDTSAVQLESPKEANEEASSNIPSAQVRDSEHETTMSPSASRIDEHNSPDMPHPPLPRLQIPSAQLDASQQQSLSEDGDRPTTPVLQPIPAENLPLPSPFPTSANQIPPSSMSDIFAKVIQDPQQSEETAPAELVTEVMQSSIVEKLEETSQPVEEPLSVTSSDGNNIPGSLSSNDRELSIQQANLETRESETTKQRQIDHARTVLQEMSQSSEVIQVTNEQPTEVEPVPAPANARDERVIPDTHEPIEYTSHDSDSSDSDIDDAAVDEPELDERYSPTGASESSTVGDMDSPWQSRRHPADYTPSDEMGSEDESSESESSESDISDTQYNEEELAELQKSDHEEVAEEPDWDLLAHQLKDEIDEEALERIDGEEEYQTEIDDRTKHDSGSELDEPVDDRSDDAIDEEDKPNLSGGSPDPEHNMWPGSEDVSSVVSESESFVSQVADVQPTYSEPPVPNHPFGLDGAFFSKDSDSNEAKALGGKQIALQAVDQNSKPPTSTLEQGLPQSSSRSKVTIIELASDSDDEDEGESPHSSAKQEEKQSIEPEQQQKRSEEQEEPRTNGHRLDDTAMAEAPGSPGEGFDENEQAYPSPIQGNDELQDLASPTPVIGTRFPNEEEQPLETKVFDAGDDSLADDVEAPEIGIKTSAEVGDDTLDPALGLSAEASLNVPGSEVAQRDMVETRPLTSSSFTTVSSTSASSPQPTQIQASQSIEEIDLSQVEPESYIPRSSILRHQPRFQSVPDNVDGTVTELVPGSSRASSSRISPAIETEHDFRMTQAQPTSFAMPSQEIGTAFSQLDRGTISKLNHVSTSQMLAIAEDGPPMDDLQSQSPQRQVALDDELLADFLEHSPQSAEDDQPHEGSVLPSVDRVQTVEDDEATQDATSSGQVKISINESGSVVPSEALSTSPLVEQVTSQFQKGSSPVPTRPFETEKGLPKNAQDKALGSTEETLPGITEEILPEVQESNPSDIPKPAIISEKISTAAEQYEPPTDFETTVSVVQPVQETNPKLAESPVTTTETPQHSETPEKMARRRSEGARSALRRSVHGKLNEVPDVISEWFTPRRSSGIIKPLPEKDTGNDEVAETPAKSPARSLMRSPTKSPVESPAKSFVKSPIKSPSKPPAKFPAISPSKISEKVPAKDYPISPPPLNRFASQGASTSLSYFTPLTALPEHLNQPVTIDILAISTSASTFPQQAKFGPRDFYTTFHVLDTSLQTYNLASGHADGKDIIVEIFRPFKMSLPETWTGDVVLLRGFAVKSRKGRLRLQSTAASGWCVWRFGDATLDHDGQEKPVWARKKEESGREEIRGPPVEVGDEERKLVQEVRGWWLDLKKEEDEAKTVAEVNDKAKGDEVKDDTNAIVKEV